MKTSATVARVLLGLVFLVFGLDGLFHFIPFPPMPPAASAFIHALIATRLFFAVKALEITAAVLLLSGRFVPLALALLAPVIFNIVWFAAALAPSSLGVGLLVLALELFSLWAVRARFLPLFTARG
jgi:uncharacterized membrane protein YphA (DoxX/SURF4 family)